MLGSKSAELRLTPVDYVMRESRKLFLFLW